MVLVFSDGFTFRVFLVTKQADYNMERMKLLRLCNLKDNQALLVFPPDPFALGNLFLMAALHRIGQDVCAMPEMGYL